MGDDTPLHLAAAHGHLDIVRLLLKNRSDVNFVNEHGNTALHYACFWGYMNVAEELVQSGALISVANKYGEIPPDKCGGQAARRLHEMALDIGQVRSTTRPSPRLRVKRHRLVWGCAGSETDRLQGPELAGPEDALQGRHAVQAQGHQHPRAVARQETGRHAVRRVLARHLAGKTADPCLHNLGKMDTTR